MLWRKAVFIILVVFCLSSFGSPQLAIVLGAALGLTIGNPFPGINDRTRELLLEASIVLLAFGADLASVYRTAKSGVLFVAVAVAAFVLLVYLFGRVLRVSRAPVLFASTENCFSINEDDTSRPSTAALVVSAIAFIVFPLIGHFTHLNSNQFGFWSAMAIPGPAFVAGSATALKGDATTVAITLALTATLLIAILAFISRQIGPKDNEIRLVIHFPWFVLLFLLAVAARTYAPLAIFPSVFDSIVNLGNAGILVGLFFVGAGISRSDIRKTHIRQLVQIFVPWLLVSAASFWAVLHLL